MGLRKKKKRTNPSAHQKLRFAAAAENLVQSSYSERIKKKSSPFFDALANTQTSIDFAKEPVPVAKEVSLAAIDSVPTYSHSFGLSVGKCSH